VAPNSIRQQQQAAYKLDEHRKTHKPFWSHLDGSIYTRANRHLWAYTKTNNIIVITNQTKTYRKTKTKTSPEFFKVVQNFNIIIVQLKPGLTNKALLHSPLGGKRLGLLVASSMQERVCLLKKVVWKKYFYWVDDQ
jgi:hypothetical protein